MFLVTPEADSMELGTWCWPRVVLIEKRPLTECERSSINRAARSVGARRVRRVGRTIGFGDCRMTWRRAGAIAFCRLTLRKKELIVR